MLDEIKGAANISVQLVTLIDDAGDKAPRSVFDHAGGKAPRSVVDDAGGTSETNSTCKLTVLRL